VWLGGRLPGWIAEKYNDFPPRYFFLFFIFLFLFYFIFLFSGRIAEKHDDFCFFIIFS
jgi:hypothetical protein